MSGQSTATPPIIQFAPSDPTQRISKTITLLSGGNHLLSKLAPSVGKKAEKQLKKLGVYIIRNLQEISHTNDVDGSSSYMVNNDITITSDLLISATGMHPNTQFLPENMLDGNSYVVTNRETLRVYGQGIGDWIYAIGDCAAYSKNYVLDVFDAVSYLMKAIALGNVAVAPSQL